MDEKPDLASLSRVLVIRPEAGDRPGDGGERVEEAVGLARAIALDVVEALAVPLKKPVPATLLGSGKVAEIGQKVEALEIHLVIVDAALTPVQQRNLERAWKAKVIDRTGLILEIFGARARTREGVLQVELAALTYQRSRLVRSWTHLERQRGGHGFLGGPGESQLELDRRRITERITKIRQELGQVSRRRAQQRSARARVPYRIVALVGYTNAGKSTLFNALTGAAVEAEDKLFATLDPTMRLVSLPSGARVILSDTVGFISELPTMLVAAFKATLEEVLAADLIVHVRDISHGSTDQQKADVLAVLRELDLDESELALRMIEVWNKIDRLDPEALARAEAAAVLQPDVHLVSAVTGAGIEPLKAAIDARLSTGFSRFEIDLHVGEGALLAWIYENCQIVSREDDGETIHLGIRADAVVRARLEERVGADRLLAPEITEALRIGAAGP